MNNASVMAHKTASVVWEPLPHARSRQETAFFLKLKLIYNVVPVSAVLQRDSVSHTCAF